MSQKKDPIAELLAGLAPAMFLGNPSGTVAFWEEKIIEAGGDADEVLEWIRQRGGYPDKSFAVSTRSALSPRVQRPTKAFYVVPEDALK